MNWLKRLWNVATRVVLPVVTAVQRVAQQREAASKPKPETKAVTPADGVSKPKPAAGPSPQPPQMPQRRTAPPNRDIGPRIDPTPAPVITPAEKRAMRELLATPTNQGLHLLVEPDADVVLKIARQVPGILETAIRLRGSFKGAFDYLLADGVRLAEEEIAGILASDGPKAVGQQADWCLDIMDRTERRACQIAQIEAMGHALLPFPSAWSDENLDNVYVSLTFSRNWEHPAHPTEFIPDDRDLPCVTLPSARLQVLRYADFWDAAHSRFDPPNITGDFKDRDYDDLRGVLEGERSALRSGTFFSSVAIPYRITYQFAEKAIHDRLLPVPGALDDDFLGLWESIKPGDVILYYNQGSAFGDFPHVMDSIGWAAQNWGYDSPLEIARGTDLLPVGIYQSLDEALKAGITQPLPYAVDRGYRQDSEQSGAEKVENQGGKPFNWNFERLGDYSGDNVLMYDMDRDSVIEIWIRQQAGYGGGNVR